jgi:type IX secretion system PorP/SprF family membrane protein
MKQHLLIVTLSLLAACFGWQPAKAQLDPHFSQYYVEPMILNPALTGAMDGDSRVSAVWRSQYNNTLTTDGVSAETVTNKHMNFGFNLLDEQTADKSYNYMNTYVTMAYTGVRFGPRHDHFLVLATSWGLINRRFDISKLQFGDQWLSSTGYDASRPSGENFVKPSASSFDAGVGALYYDATPNSAVSFFGGVGAFHLTRPANPMLSADGAQPLPIRFSVHAGLRIVENEYFSIVPSAVFMKEGNAEEKMAGAYVQLYASEDCDVMFGANYRWQDAIVPFVGIYYKGLTCGMSYDVNQNPGEAVVSNNGSFEVSISYIFQKSAVKTNKFFCPRF